MPYCYLTVANRRWSVLFSELRAGRRVNNPPQATSLHYRLSPTRGLPHPPNSAPDARINAGV